MSRTIIPSQIGYTAPDSKLRSQIYLGKNINASFEAIGMGAGGRPDQLQALKIHLSKDNVSYAVLYLDITDVIELKKQNSKITDKDEIFLKLRQVSVCEVGSDGESKEKAMIIMASQTFDLPS